MSGRFSLSNTINPSTRFVRPVPTPFKGPSVRLNLSSPMINRVATAKQGCGACGK